MATTPRSYDATRRRERAEEERSATRRRVIEAARELFVRKGYVATTVADIAKEAGVALQSVYNAGQSKAMLMHQVVDLAVAGDDQEILLTDRPTYAVVAELPTAEQQVEVLAELIAETMQRLAPVWVAYREAAAVDPTGAENLAAAHRRRNETFRTLVEMIDPARLRLPPEEATDTAWAIGSIDVYLLLRSIRGWDHEQYAGWLRRTLVHQLLMPA